MCPLREQHPGMALPAWALSGESRGGLATKRLEGLGRLFVVDVEVGLCGSPSGAGVYRGDWSFQWIVLPALALCQGWLGWSSFPLLP